MKAIIIVLAILALAYADQYVPIPSKPYGFSLGDPDGTFHIQAFLDLQCTPLNTKGPDSKASFNTMMSVMKTIDFRAKGIKFTFQHVPLPYHFYAFKLHQGTTSHIQPSFTSKITYRLKIPSISSIISSLIRINTRNRPSWNTASPSAWINYQHLSPMLPYLCYNKES